MMVAKSMAAVLACVAGTACAMTSAADIGANCRVVGAERLPENAGSSEEICNLVRKAVKVKAPAARYAVTIQVVSPYMLSATIEVDGKSLPPLKLGVSDGTLPRSSIARFADAIGEQVSAAADQASAS